MNTVDDDTIVGLMVVNHDIVCLDVQVGNVVGMHGCQSPQSVSQDALLRSQRHGLPRKVHQVVGKVLVDEHLLAGNGVVDSPQIGARTQLGLQCQSIVVVRVKEALEYVALLVRLCQVDKSILSVLEDSLDGIVSTRSSL